MFNCLINLLLQFYFFVLFPIRASGFSLEYIHTYVYIYIFCFVLHSFSKNKNGLGVFHSAIDIWEKSLLVGMNLLCAKRQKEHSIAFFPPFKRKLVFLKRVTF